MIKQKDLALLIIVVFISILVSMFASNLIFASKGYHLEQVESVPSISSRLNYPPKNYFNHSAIDPTPKTVISSNNAIPFNNSGA